MGKPPHSALFRRYSLKDIEVCVFARLKKDVVVLDGALDKLDAIRGVHYNWIDAAQPQDRQVGVIAQEIQAVYPELVKEGGNGFLSVDYPKLTAVLIQSIKELKAMVVALVNK